MKRYSELLKKGKGRMEALLAVQRELCTKPELAGWSGPRFLATWQLVGDMGLIQGL